VHRHNTTLFVRSNMLVNPRIALSVVGLFEACVSTVPKFPSLEFSLAFHLVMMIWLGQEATTHPLAFGLRNNPPNNMGCLLSRRV
jgi:hypothetical protein